VRTTNQIERDLAKGFGMIRLSNANNDYLQCRLDPFNAKPSAGIPDGNSLPKIVIDHRIATTVTVGTSGNFSVVIVPCLPHMQLFKAATSITGYTLSSGVTPSTLSLYGTPGFWTSMQTPREFAAYQAYTGSGLQEVFGPYSASAFRIVTLATRVSYTGVPTAASGTYTVYSDSARKEDGRRPAALPVDVNSGVSMSSGDSYITSLDLNPPQGMLSAGTLVQRTDIPLMVINKHVGDYNFVDVPGSKTFLVDTTLTATPTWVSTIASAAPPLTAGVLGYDSSWQPAVIQIDGAATGATFRFETIICVEYVPGVQSDAYRLAKPSANAPQAIAETETQVAKTPVARNDATNLDLAINSRF